MNENISLDQLSYDPETENVSFKIGGVRNVSVFGRFRLPEYGNHSEREAQQMARKKLKALLRTLADRI